MDELFNLYGVYSLCQIEMRKCVSVMWCMYGAVRTCICACRELKLVCPIFTYQLVLGICMRVCGFWCDNVDWH